MAFKIQYQFIVYIAIALFFLGVSAEATEDVVIAIIVPPISKIQKVDLGELSLIFSRKKIYSSEGKRIIPINLPINHQIRRWFSNLVLGGSPETQAEYWNEAYYHGINPPHVVGSEESAIRFVENTPGAIAYINACQVRNTVKPIAWITLEGNLLLQAPLLNCL